MKQYQNQYSSSCIVKMLTSEVKWAVHVSFLDFLLMVYVMNLLAAQTTVSKSRIINE
jgi:hypothetical protein